MLGYRECGLGRCSIPDEFFVILARFLAMNAAAPHYLLFSGSSGRSEPGQWRFMLRTMDGSEQIAAEEVEPDTHGERLELLAVVRGLEALDQPSRVTLVTPSRYVRQGIRNGLGEWRVNGWRWERFGEMVPVKNRDLWQRVDRALRFHKLECRNIRFDGPHETTSVGASERRRPGHAISPRAGEPPVLCRRPDTVYRRVDCAAAADSSAGSWHARLGLGKLFSLVKLLYQNRRAALAAGLGLQGGLRADEGGIRTSRATG